MASSSSAPAFLSHAASNRSVQLAATAVLSGAAVAAAILGYQRLAKESRLARLKESIPPSPSLPPPIAAAATAAAKNDGTAHLALDALLPSPVPADPDDARTLALARRAQAGDYDDAVILEQLARNRAFLTPAGLDKLRGSLVVVVGCGGVGSHCAAALARSGCAHLRLVDFDQVSLSSLNRHAVATLADVGRPKVAVLARRLLAVAPWVRFDLRPEMFDAASAERLLGPGDDDDTKGGINSTNSNSNSGQEGKKKKQQTKAVDFVVDAIDNIDTKVALLKYCHDNGIPVISAMGAGVKSDPTRVLVSDISATKVDGLSRAVRRRLKLLGVTDGIPVVSSTETAGEGKAELLPLPDEQFQKGKEAVRELGVAQDFRVRILPVLGTMPAVFGYTAANHVILNITGYPCDYSLGKGRDKLYDQVYASLQTAEEKLARTRNGGAPVVGLKLPLSLGDVSFLVEDVYRGRSVVTGIATRLALVRWELPQGSTVLQIGEGQDEQKSALLRLSDLVCMTKEEAARHLKDVLLDGKSPEDLYDEETLRRVKDRRREAEEAEKYR